MLLMKAWEGGARLRRYQGWEPLLQPNQPAMPQESVKLADSEGSEVLVAMSSADQKMQFASHFMLWNACNLWSAISAQQQVSLDVRQHSVCYPSVAAETCRHNSKSNT